MFRILTHFRSRRCLEDVYSKQIMRCKHNKRLKNLRCNCQLLPAAQKLVDKYRFLIQNEHNSPASVHEYLTTNREKFTKMSPAPNTQGVDSSMAQLQIQNLNSIPDDSYAPEPNANLWSPPPLSIFDSRKKSIHEFSEYSEISSVCDSVCNNADCYNEYLFGSESDTNSTIPTVSSLHRRSTERVKESTKNFHIESAEHGISEIRSPEEVLRIMNHTCPVHSNISISEAYALLGFRENQDTMTSYPNFLQCVSNAGIFGTSNAATVSRIQQKNTPKQKSTPGSSRTMTMKEIGPAQNNRNLWQCILYYAKIVLVILVVAALVCCGIACCMKKRLVKGSQHPVLEFFKNLMMYLHSLFRK